MSNIGGPDPAVSASDDDLADPTDRLREILEDPTLPNRDKRQAIQEALDELQRERGDEPAAAYEPLERRFFEALSLLAEGGHDYDEPSADDAQTPPERSRTMDDV